MTTKTQGGYLGVNLLENRRIIVEQKQQKRTQKDFR